jgi:hypothetical protein
VSRLFTILSVWFCCAFAAGFAQAETYQLKDGQILTGEFVSGDEHGVLLKLGENKYSERIPWGKFSQNDLKDIAQKNPKVAQLIDPFIELTQDEKIQRSTIVIKESSRLQRPAAGSLLGSLLSSGIGLFIVFVLYLANLYAAFEISRYRARPAGLVCGVSAVAPVVGPIIFLSLPMQLKRAEVKEREEDVLPEAPPEEYADDQNATPSAVAGGLHIARPETGSTQAQHGTGAAAPALPPTVVYERGQFTFNRRFFETKFPGFFGVAPRDAEKDMLVVIKSARGEFVGQRISRITATELHFQVNKGGASEEVAIPFLDVKQVQLKHKDA